MAKISPDAEDILEAISTINGGACVIPEDVDAAVHHMVHSMGKEASLLCAGRSPEFMRGFLIGWAAHIKSL